MNTNSYIRQASAILPLLPGPIDGVELDGVNRWEEPTDSPHAADVEYWSVFVHVQHHGRWCVGDFSRYGDAVAYQIDLNRLYLPDLDPEVTE